jgi:hypothetical protein
LAEGYGRAESCSTPGSQEMGMEEWRWGQAMCTSYSPQGHAPGDLLPQARVLKFPESSKLVPSAGDHAVNKEPTEDISYSEHNRQAWF